MRDISYIPVEAVQATPLRTVIVQSLSDIFRCPLDASDGVASYSRINAFQAVQSCHTCSWATDYKVALLFGAGTASPFPPTLALIASAYHKLAGRAKYKGFST